MRLLVYDRTCIGQGGNLTPAWATGAKLYRALGRIDAVRGVASWAEALAWLAAQQATIREIQYWGQGTWGCARVDRDVLDIGALRPASPHHGRLEAIRERLAPDALIWFRTCETFGARAGIEFAERFATFLGARIAGHTRRIGFHQSGLYGLAPGARVNWSGSDGLALGTPEAPRRSQPSRPWAPRTITCLQGAVPARWVAVR